MEQEKEKVNKPLLQRTYVIVPLALVCCLLWGSAFPCIKIGYKLFNIAADDVASQILFAGARFTLAGVLAIAIGSALQKKILIPARTSWWMVIKLSLAQTLIQYIFFYIGLAHTTGVKSSIINASNVFISILLSCLVFHYEKLTVAKVIGCLAGFGGVVVINLGGGFGGSMSFLGEGFLFLAAFSHSMSVVLMKKFSQRENPVTLSGYQFLIGGAIMAIIGLIAGGRLHGFTVKSVALLIYMAMISAVAYSIWSVLLKHNPVGRVSIFGFMNPVFGVILSALLLQEQNQAFTWQGAVALVLVCIGIFIVNRKSEPNRNKEIKSENCPTDAQTQESDLNQK